MIRSGGAWIRRHARRLALGAGGVVVACASALAAWWFLFPFPMHRITPARVRACVSDSQGGLLLRTVASDGQWREPVSLEAMGPWLEPATLAGEDERFHAHPGIDPVAVVRAVGQDLLSGSIVSGASTVSMQLSRICEPRRRTLAAKAVQAFRALQLERTMSKHDILEAYLNMAPYGGNVRGVQAASRRWFGKQASDLTLAEAALIAGLPKSPERLRPDRFPKQALIRRDWILARMRTLGSITQAQCDQAVREPLRLAPVSPRREVPQAAWLALCERSAGGLTSLVPSDQALLESSIASHVRSFPEGTQASGVVIDLATGCVRAMVGSCGFSEVNGAIARRSPGSALKPFIYAAAFDAGRLSPESIVDDVPITRAGWQPENFSRGYAGKVSVADALRRSLNVPAILVTEGVGLQRCVSMLRRAGVRLDEASARRAGLGLAVGTVEVSLLELTNAYATLGRHGSFVETTMYPRSSAPSTRAMSRTAADAVSEVLSCRRRTPRGLNAEAAATIPWFCWKTGTSSGRRDAWAVGHNGSVAIGIWVGDFSGKGRVEYLGAESAEPILAELFTSPAFASTEEPPAAAPVAVVDPLPMPQERAEAMRVLFPGAGSVFIAVGGQVSLTPRSSRAGTWFLDGVRVASGSLACRPGSHELRCVAADGDSDAVRVTVRAE